MRLEEFLSERMFKPLKMQDTGFFVPQEKIERLAQPLPSDPTSGKPNRLLDVSAPPKNASGGAGAVSTAADYLRFSQMLLNGGQLEGARVLSPTTVRLMTSDHLGSTIRPVVEPGELLLGTKGYTFGLGFAVRKEDGLAGVPGSQGEFMWAGYAGTYFWVDPKQQLVAVLMTQAPSGLSEVEKYTRAADQIRLAEQASSYGSVIPRARAGAVHVEDGRQTLVFTDGA
jgi:CubicO group peptidase (beta-lactamase class C family)